MAAWSWLPREPHDGHPAWSPGSLCVVGGWYWHLNMPSRFCPTVFTQRTSLRGGQGQGQSQSQTWGGLGCAGGSHSPPQPPATPPAHAGSSSCPCCCSLPCQSPMPAHSVPLSPSLKFLFDRELTEIGKGMPGRCHQSPVCLCLDSIHPLPQVTTALSASPHTIHPRTKPEVLREYRILVLSRLLWASRDTQHPWTPAIWGATARASAGIGVWRRTNLSVEGVWQSSVPLVLWWCSSPTSRLFSHHDTSQFSNAASRCN